MLTLTMESAAEFEEAAKADFMPVFVTPRDDFRVRSTVHELGDAVMMTRNQNSPLLRMMRTNRMAARTGRDDLLIFCVNLAGSSRLRHAGQVTSLSPGSGTLWETRSSWELENMTTSHSLALRFPRSALGLRDAEIRFGLTNVLHPSTPGMQLLSGYFKEIARLSSNLIAALRYDAGLVAIDMIGMALRGGLATVPDEGGARDVFLAMMQHHIRQQLADPGLTVAALASRHHISVRHLQSLFARIGLTPAGYIREQRLLAAKAMLSDQHFARRSIDEIAGEVGILQLRTFQRAFVRRFGMTPSQWRRESVPRQ